MTLPLVIAPGDAGHIGDHEEIGELLDRLDGQSTFLAAGFAADLLGSRPAASAGNLGSFYLAQDVPSLGYSDGALWQDLIGAAAANRFTGPNDFDDDVFFGSGSPWIDVRNDQYGAEGDGATDDLAPINAALAAVPAGGAIVLLSIGVYVVGGTLTLTVDGTVLMGAGPGSVIKAKAGTDFQNVLSATGRSNVHVCSLTVDANQANRSGVMSTTAAGGTFTGCTDSSFVKVTVKNTLGTGSASANGMAFGGTSTRCTIAFCIALDLGTTAKPSDAFYVSGGHSNAIVSCKGTNVTDTVAVLEACNYSQIAHIIGRTVGCVAGISNSGATDVTGNSMADVTGYGWSATVAGGIQIAALSTGNLVNTRVSGVTLYSDSVVGTGPAFYVRKPSTGRNIRVTIGDLQVFGAGTQAVVMCAEKVLLHDFHLEGAVDQPIQVLTGSAAVKITNGVIEATTLQVAILTTGTDTTVDGVDINGNPSYGVYCAGTTTTGYVQIRNIGGHATYGQLIVGADAGTTPYVDVSGSFNPETNLAGAIGSRFSRLDGGALTSFYVKQSVAGQKTGWAGK